MKKSNSNTFWVVLFLLALNLLSICVWWFKIFECMIYGFCLGMIVREMRNGEE